MNSQSAEVRGAYGAPGQGCLAGAVDAVIESHHSSAEVHSQVAGGAVA